MKASSDDILNFFGQLGEMLNSGVPLIVALDVFGKDHDSPMASLASFLVSRLEAGHSLSGALAKHQQVLPATLIVLLQIGEKTGQLPQTMLQATTWLRQDRDLVRKVKGSLTYPFVVLAFSLAMTLMLFTTIVPKLLAVVQSMGTELPWPTKIVATISATLCEPFFWLAAASVLSLAGYQLSKPETRARVFQRLTRTALELPLLGSTLVSYFFVRFCSGLAILIENGVGVLEAVSLSQELSGHPDLLDDRDEFRQRVQEGLSLAQSMEARPESYPPLVVSFVLLGEESANLAAAVTYAAQMQDMILQERLTSFRQALEPIMTLGVGILVAVVLLATVLPLYSIVSAL